MKYVLITGANSGMGFATTQKLADEGYYVFACDINKPSFSAENIMNIQMDVTAMDSVEKALVEVKKITEELFAVINFAGIIMMNSLIEISETDFMKIFNVNVFGAYRVNKVFFPLIQKGRGKVIITTSELAPNKILPFNAIYSISKKSLDAYAQGLTMELGLLNIPVITLRPGAVETAIIKDSNEEMEKLNANTELYKNTITKFKSIVDKEQSSAVPASEIANLVSKILKIKHTKYVYTKNTSAKLKLLNAVPLKLQLKLFKLILK